MQIWLVRHALAVDREAFSGADEERPLTLQGERRFRRFCHWLTSTATPPDRIISSPAVRAAETAAILAKASGIRKREIDFSDLLAPGCNIEKLLRLLHHETAERIAIVGHEPDFSQLLSELIGRASVRFGKGCVAAVDFSAQPTLGGGELRWFVGPKLG